MEMIHALVEQYADLNTTPPDEVCAELMKFTQQHHKHAHMLSSAEQGKLLEFISLMMNAERILEIGTFTGYSAICLAKGLSATGHLHTIELREEDAAIAKRFIEQARLSGKITIHIGDAKNIIRDLNETWDIVFIDADKVGYIEYYELTLPSVRPGGLIIADNVLFHGQVLEEPLKGKNPVAINEFNKHVKEDNRVEQVLLTIRDGLTLIRKL